VTITYEDQDMTDAEPQTGDSVRMEMRKDLYKTMMADWQSTAGRIITIDGAPAFRIAIWNDPETSKPGLPPWQADLIAHMVAMLPGLMAIAISTHRRERHSRNLIDEADEIVSKLQEMMP
jgi:hypothetical protein